MRPLRATAALACLALAAASPAAPAQDLVGVTDGDEAELSFSRSADPARRPDSAGRSIAEYDFEEQLTNPLPVPVGWVRGQHDPEAPRIRPGFPTWNAATLDYDAPAHAGEGSVRLPVKGDSASLVLVPGVLSVFADGDYLASVHVRTARMVHARAQLVVRLLDHSLQPVAESRSRLVTSEGRWTRLEAPITGGREGAAFLQLELLVLQPEQYDPVPPDAQFRVSSEDFDAAAWFDDVSVIAVPRIEVVPDAPGGVAIGAAPPALDMLVRDLAGQAISVDVVVTDADGAEIDRIRRDMPGGRFVETWAPDLPEYGWYRIDLTVHAADRDVGSATSALVWAPAPTGGSDSGPSAGRPGSGAPSIGLIASSGSPALIRELPTLARVLNADAVDISLWDPALPPPTGADAAQGVAPLIDRLLLDQRRVTLSFPSLPERDASALSIDPDDMIAYFAADPASLAELVDPVLDRFGQRVERWGLGATASPAPFSHERLAHDLDRATDAVARLVTAPTIGVPWRTDQALDPALASPGRSASLHVLPGTPAAVLSQLAEDWAAALAQAPPGAGAHTEPAGLTISLSAADERIVGARPAAAELARSVITLWAAFSTDGATETAGSRVTIAALDPWSVVDERRPRVEPDPALAVWRTLSARLRGRRVTRSLPLGEGVHAFLLEPPVHATDAAAIAIWSDTPREFELHLGEHALTRVDLFGNTAPVPAATYEDPLVAPAAIIETSPEPVIIEGVDATLARMLASVSLTPAMLPGDIDEHMLTLRMDNPWPTTIQGAVYILEPGGFSDPDTPADRSWKIAPRKIPFALRPGESLEREIILAHSPAEQAGAKPLVFDVAFVTDRDRGVHRVTRELRVGLPGVRLDLAARASPPGEDEPVVAVEAVITNTTGADMSFDLLVIAPGQPRVRRHVADLASGESIARTFAFPAGESAAGQRIAVSLERTDATGRLNQSVVVE